MYSEYAWTGADTGILVIGIALGLAVVLFKGLGLWHSARHSQKWWFIAMLILDTLAILPLIYLLFFRLDRKKTDIFGRKKKRKRKR